MSPRDEQTVYGVKAALAVLEHRPRAVRRIFHGTALRTLLAPHLSAAAARHVLYRELPSDELAKVAESTHHEGLVVVTDPLRYRALSAEAARAAGAAALWLALDGVENPHNLGALLRTAAFFGLSGVIVGGTAPGGKVNAAMLRVAEGGAEHVPLAGATPLAPALALLRQGGTRIVGLETDGALPLPDAVAEGLTEGPLALVLGAEREGLSADVRAVCGALCVLRGAGPLASLNVSAAAAVALGEVLRGRPAPGRAKLPESAAPSRAPSGAPSGPSRAHPRPQEKGPTSAPPRPKGRRIRPGKAR